MKIVLGSASERRQAILKDMGYDFEVLTSDIDEKTIRHDDPKNLTIALANAKTDALLPKLPKDVILITSDIVGEFEGKILERPASKEEARQILENYRDKPLVTVCAVVVTNTKTGKRLEGVDISKVWFKPFSEEFYKDFVDSGIVLQYAASFAIMHPLCKPFIDRIEGTIESIAGLPMQLTRELIDKAA